MVNGRLAKSLVRISSAGLFFILVSLLSFNANAVDVSGGASAGQIEKRFESQPEVKSQPRYIFVPRLSGFEAPAGAEKIRFTLKQLHLDGVTAYPEEELKSLYADLQDSEVSLKQIYELANDLTEKYGNDGYLLSRAFVPPQTVEKGEIRIQVLEGYIDEVVIEDLPDHLRPDVIEHYISQIKNARPLTSEVLERYLMLANDLPGVRFKSVLSASSENLGATRLTLSATRKNWQGQVSIDNYGSDSSGPWQVLLEGGVNNLFNRLDNTTLRLATVPEDDDELHYVQFSHQQVVNGEGLKFQFDASYTKSEPGTAALRLLQVETESSSANLSLNYPLIRSREKNLTISGGLIVRDSTTTQLGLVTADDKLNIAHLGVVFDRVDTFAGGGVNLLSVTLHQGLNSFGANVSSRVGAEADFSSLSIHARRSQAINEKWNAELRVAGMLSGETLPSSEQFSLGGENTVRGYAPSEWTGDEAVSTSLELNYRPEVEWDGGMQLYGFYDYGKVWRDNPQVGENLNDSLDAWGLGTRLSFKGNVSVSLELAKPLERDSNGITPDWQMYGRIRVVL